MTSWLDPPSRTLRQYFFIPAWHQSMYVAAAHLTHAAELPDTSRGSWRELDPSLDIHEPNQALLLADRVATRLLVAAATVIDLLFDSPETAGSYVPHELDRRVLKKTLPELVEPSAAVLLAGIRRHGSMERLELTWDKEGSLELRPSKDAPSREHLLDRLVNIDSPAQAADQLTPEELVNYATDRKPLSPRVSYNLACFYSSELHRTPKQTEQRRRVADRSVDHLEDAFALMDQQERAQLVKWAGIDPSLQPLHGHGRFRRLLSTYRQPKIFGDTGPHG